MRSTISKFNWASAFTCVLCLPALTHASPQLQLGIVDGTYDWSTETIVKGDDILTVVALTNGVSGKKPDFSFNEDYYLSVAIIPSLPLGDLDLGSFDITTLDGASSLQTLEVTADLNYGTPPLDVVLQNKDLPSHGIFETYYAEIPFKFVAIDSAADINTQDSPSTSLDESGSDLYFVKFDVDKTNLADGYELHFDLYDTKIKNGEYYLDGFAPFSHDAETVPPEDDGGGGDVIPEPATAFVWLLLIGMGLAWRRYR